MRLFKESMKTKILAFNTVVREVIEYASQVWSPYTVVLLDKLETIQRQAVRWVSKLNQTDSVSKCMKFS